MGQKNYILGLDLGIASVGWAVVEIDKDENPLGLIDCGVRTFNAPEDKDKKSLSSIRSEARGVRRTTRRRASRLLKLRRLFKHQGLLKKSDFDEQGYLKPCQMTWYALGAKDNNLKDRILTTKPITDNTLDYLPIGVWGWRVLGLEQQLAPNEWAHVLYHLVNHRGYKPSSESSKKDKDEAKVVLFGVQENQKKLKEKGLRTPAELAVSDFSETGHLRNHSGEYNHSFSRHDLVSELELLFSAQRDFNNPYASKKFEQKVKDLLIYQKPALSGDDLLEMVGFCQFEPEERRAPQACHSFQLFRWYSTLNHLYILDNGSRRKLTKDECQNLTDEVFGEKPKQKITYKQIRTYLELPDTTCFSGLRYGDAKADNPEKAEIIKDTTYYQVYKLLKDSFPEEWEEIRHSNHLLDVIGSAFSLYKTEEDITNYLKQNGLPEKVIPTLISKLSFSKFGHLSLCALKKILPLMINEGLRYDEACTKVYGSHSVVEKNIQKQKLLPAIPADETNNPVVSRSLSQARKVINAVIRLYGSPARIHIETGRELGKSTAEREEIEKQQRKNKKAKEASKVELITTIRKELGKDIHEVMGKDESQINNNDILKYQLYVQQKRICLYSGKPIDLARLFKTGYVEIDHALPFSLTWDNSIKNKVLVLIQENQNKGNKTPYEYFGAGKDPNQWINFVTRVNNSNFPKTKKQYILTTELNSDEFIDRNLNDTRYMARFLVNFIGDNLILVGQGKRKVFATNGRITGFLRHYWELNKNRDLNDRHHAVDAIVIACSRAGMQQKITKYFQNKENSQVRGKINIPTPWLSEDEGHRAFQKDITIRVFSDTPLEEIEQYSDISRHYQERGYNHITPLFVSRPPRRKISGRLHGDTIQSAKQLTEGYTIKRISLGKLTQENLDNTDYSVREPDVYQTLTEKLESKEIGNGKQCEVTKPSHQSKQVAIKSVKIRDNGTSGFLVRKGIADNDSMIRIDIYKRSGKNYAVPIYLWQIRTGIEPNKAVVSNKSEDEWLEMKPEEFQFSLYPDDLVYLERKPRKVSNKSSNKSDKILGYYKSFNRALGQINVMEHDKDKQKGKNGEHTSIGIQNLLVFEKYQVDVLGKVISKCRPAKHQEKDDES